VAEGLAAGNPGKKVTGPAAAARGKGLAGDAEDDEILAMQRRLARVEGIWAGPTGVATLAVLARLVASQALDGAQTVCAIISETGLKTEAEPPSRTGTPSITTRSGASSPSAWPRCRCPEASTSGRRAPSRVTCSAA